MIVIGGNNWQLGGDLSNVEVLDIYDPSIDCEPISDYPKEDRGMTAGMIDGSIKSCGSQHDSAECYDYDPATDTWTQSLYMINSRYNPKSSFIDGVWLLTGDGDSTIDFPQSTEMWTGTNFVEGPSLPVPMHDHCQLTINSTHLFFASDKNNPSYFLDWEQDIWTELPSMTQGVYLPSCGLINNPENGLEVVVATVGSSEIFNINTMQWRAGPSLGQIFAAGVGQLTDTFLLVGGENYSGGSPLHTIYQFDHINYDWVLLHNRLGLGRKGYLGVVTVTNEFVTCS